VQRYLTGKSISQSRLSLLFNAVAKIPMQFFILFIGAMVFVFYLFVQPPLLFQQAELKRIGAMSEFAPMSEQYERAFEQRKRAALAMVDAHHAGDSAGEARQRAEYRAAQKELDGARTSASKLVEQTGGEKGFNDTNYIFLSFVTKYLPSGVVGLVIAVIFAATMSASSGEINSLATVSVIDIYQRHFKRGASDMHYLWASRWLTLFWGVYAVVFAGWAKRLGSLIVAVNKVGSLFYGSLLGCFALAILFPRVRGTAVFTGMLLGEAAIFATAWLTDISWLWYNVIGCAVVMITALVITYFSPGTTFARPDTQSQE
jgi:Na+/proline symporter